MPASPNVLNYYIGRGALSIKLTGEGAFRLVGNVPELELTPEIETLEHKSSLSGVKTLDREVVLEAGGTLRIVLDEITGENLQLAMVGAITENTAGEREIDIMSLSELKGAVNFVGANAIGQQVDISLLSVDFSKGSPFSVISDEWGQIEITGKLLAVAGVFGTMTVRDIETA